MPVSDDLPEGLARMFAQVTTPQPGMSRPWVTLSYAQSLDGSLAVERGKPLVVSGMQALKLTHQLRASHQAILVGIGTVLADDPRLTVRLVNGDDPQPVVLDNHLRFPLGARLIENHKPPWIITTNQASMARQSALEQRGVRILRVPSSPVSLVNALQVLWQEGIHSVMVEGGARVITAFLQARLVDAMVITIAPMLVGGIKAVEGVVFSEGDSSKENNFPRLEGSETCRLGEDLVIWGRIGWA
jgi:riboflavin-specific deaminase-like protein